MFGVYTNRDRHRQPFSLRANFIDLFGEIFYFILTLFYRKIIEECRNYGVSDHDFRPDYYLSRVQYEDLRGYHENYIG